MFGSNTEMYIKVILGDYPRGELGSGDQRIPSEVLVNPECPIRVIYDFIRKTFQININYEIDLCDECGNLIFMYEKDYWMYGLNYFLPKSTYYVVLFEKDDGSRVVNPLLFLPDSAKKNSVQWNDLMGKIRKQMNPALSKPSRMSKTRVGSSHVKNSLN